MRSPFPGMDPYLERHWRDVHGTLIVEARAAINRQLGGGLRARIDQRLVIEQPWEPSYAMLPDVHVVQRGPAGRPAATGGGAVVAEPLVVEMTEPTRERFIEIIDPASGGKVITVIEFLSPTNKLPGDGRTKYLRKQRDVLDANLNLVEIDLTRTGERELAYPVGALPPSHQTAYLACVYRGHGTRHFEVYAMPLRERLPVIRIPLRDADTDVTLDIQSLVDRAYEDGRYDDIDYTRPCTPPLETGDAAWAAGLLKPAENR